MTPQKPDPVEQRDSRPPTQPPAPKGRTKALVLALLMHGLLVAMLFVGIRWKSQEPESVSAELWTPPPPPKVETPRPPEPPKPVPQPAPPPPPPPPKVEAPKPDIALEQERKRQEEEKRQRERKAQEEKARKEAEQKKLAEEKARKEAEVKKAAEEKARKEAEEKKLAEEKARKEAEAKKAAEEKKLAEARQRAEDEKRRQQLVDAERARAAQLLSQGAGSGTSGSAAAGDGAAMATWGGQIKALIRDATTYSSAGNANPEARFRIRLSAPPTAPAKSDVRDCRVVEVQLTRSSGEQAWDRAAEQAIRKSSPWPRMPNGSCPGDAIEITQRPRD